MKKRQWAIVSGVIILVLAFLGYRFLANTPQESKPSKSSPIKGVEVIVVENQAVPVQIELDGRLNARNKISIFAEVSGVLQQGSKKFEEGVRFRKGEVLLVLENSEATAAFLQSRSQFVNVLTQALPDIKLDYPQQFPAWQDYRNRISGNGGALPPLPQANDQLQLFLTGRQVYSSYQSVQSSSVRLGKYRIRAPFNGIVTESNVDPGILVSPGQRLGEFIAPGNYELEASVSSAALAMIEDGDSVSLRSQDSDRQYHGTVFRRNAKVDPNSQQVKIFVKVEGDDLRDGLFMKGSIATSPVAQAFRLDRKLLYQGEFTYLVQDSSLRRQPLEVVQKRPGSVIVKGLPNGSQIPSQPISGAFDGMPVQVIDTLESNKR